MSVLLVLTLVTTISFDVAVNSAYAVGEENAEAAPATEPAAQPAEKCST